MTPKSYKNPQKVTKVQARNVSVIGDHNRIEGGINYYLRLVVSPIGLFVLGIIILTVAYFALAAQRQLPTWLLPRAFSPAADDETLIIVTDFADRSEGKYTGIDPAQYIYEQLAERVRQDGLSLRVERLHQTVDDNTARMVGARYGATLLLWGWYDAVGITSRLEHINIAEAIPGCPICEESRLRLAAPETIEFQQNIFATLPDRATYLVYFALGMGSGIRGNLDMALTYFSNALDIAELGTSGITADETCFYQGNIYMSRGQYELAVEKYTYAITLNPDFYMAYNNRGYTYFEMNEYEKTLDDFNRALELNPEDAMLYNNRGLVYSQIEQDDKAIADFDRALELDPEFDDAYHNRGLTWAMMDEFEKALDDFSRTLELDPEDVEAYSNRGNVYYQMGDYDKALDDLDHAVELMPHPTIYYNIASVYAFQGFSADACTWLTRAIVLDSQYRELARAHPDFDPIRDEPCFQALMNEDTP